MKCAGYRFFFICLLALSLLPVSGNADEIYPTITDIFFDKDGQPYNEPVEFTVNCYGYLCKSWDCKRDPADLVARQGEFSPELVFSYHASCPHYGCRIYEPYFHAERVIGASCNLEGTAGGKTLSILNFSQSVIPKNCSRLQQYDIGKGYDKYYRVTPEFVQCENESHEVAELCNQYVIPCSPGSDADCGNRMVDGRYVKDSEKSRSCREEADKNERACQKYLEKVDLVTMVLWKNNWTGQYEPAVRACELRLTIPAGIQVPATSPSVSASPGITAGTGIHMPDIIFGTRAVAPPRSSSPVESLYCSILRAFGGRCE